MQILKQIQLDINRFIEEKTAGVCVIHNYRQ